MSNSRKFLAKVVTPDQIAAALSNLEAGRILIVNDNGKARMIAGLGDQLPKNLNYIGESIYTNPNPTTVEAFGIPKNTILQGKGSAEILDQMLNQYQKVSLTSLSSSIVEIEVGDSLTGNIELTPSVANYNNLRDTNKALASSSPIIFPDTFFDPSAKAVLALNSYSSNTIRTIRLTVTIYGKGGETSSRTVNLTFKAKMYWGSLELNQLTSEADIKSLSNNDLVAARKGTFTFGAGYPYLVFPTLVSLSGIGFTDIDLTTGKELLPYAFSRKSDITFSNGFINVTHAVYRADNYMTGTTKCKVS